MPQRFAEQMRSVPMTASLGESLERAQSFARAQQHRAVLLEHLLLALTEDPEASTVLRTCNVDVDRLGTDASVYLGRLMEDMRADEGEEPTADLELIKVLQAAGQAAQQSKRKQIDGAIVLAAIVGDAKSPAAGLLESHGLTFDDAIRALQKAKAQARTRQFDGGGPTQALPAADPPAPAAERPGLAAAAEAAGVQSAGAGQSADEILAAARVRIQQRAAADTKKPATAPSPAKPPQDRVELPPAPPVPPQAAPNAPPSPPPGQGEVLPLSSLSSRTAAASAAGGLEIAEPAGQPPSTPLAPPFPPLPPATPAAAAAAQRPNWPPTPIARLPQTQSQLPAQHAVPSPHYAGAPPPLSRRPGSGGPRPGLPGPPAQSARAPWPDPAEPAVQPRPVAPNGTGSSRRPASEAGAQTSRRHSKRQGTSQSASGPLAESIPRRMRVGLSATAQVRIARDKIDGLIHLLLDQRGIAHRPEAFMVRSLSVRLRAPDGGFFIEPETPETLWVLPAAQQQDEFASWQWTITPQWRGKGRLQLLVTARTVGRDGVAAEMAPPDRIIEVAVKGRPLRALGRLIRILSAIAFGAALGRFGGEIWSIASAVAKRMAGG